MFKLNNKRIIYEVNELRKRKDLTLKNIWENI